MSVTETNRLVSIAASHPSKHVRRAGQLTAITLGALNQANIPWTIRAGTKRQIVIAGKLIGKYEHPNAAPSNGRAPHGGQISIFQLQGYGRRSVPVLEIRDEREATVAAQTIGLMK